jgi:peptidoglycan-associated lipoprotein
MKRYGILLAVCMALVMALTLTSGCSAPKKATKEDVTKPGTKPGLSEEELAKQRADQEARDRALREQAIRDQEARERAERDKAAADAASLKDLSRIYFEFDRVELSNEAREILGRVAGQLKASPKKTLTIEGNCDDRGTNEYNLALGQTGPTVQPATCRPSESTASGSRRSATVRSARSARRRQRPAG